MDSATKPSVLMVNFSDTHQTENVMKEKAEVLGDRGGYMALASLPFTDPRCHGVKIPPTTLRDYHLDEARKVAGELGDRLVYAGINK